MIFVSVGTHNQQFDRLLMAIDKAINMGAIKEEVFAQIGHSTYVPKNFKHCKFMSIDEFDKCVKNCSLFITHAGEGNIGTGLQFEKKMIVMPRLKRFGEHTNDHQLELADAIGKNKQAIIVLGSDITGALKEVKKLNLQGTAHAKGIINIINNFLGE